jgi:hypothetical protein
MRDPKPKTFSIFLTGFQGEVERKAPLLLERRAGLFQREAKIRPWQGASRRR